MTIRVTIPNTSSDSLTFGSGNTPTAAQVIGIDSGSSNGQLAFNTTASGTSTERMRITAAGDVGIGTSSPESIGSFSMLQVGQTNTGIVQTYDGTTKTAMYGTTGVGYIATRTNHPLAFNTNGSERARIDTSGNLLVGTTTANARLTTNGVSNTSADNSLVARKLDNTVVLQIRNDGYVFLPTTYSNTTANAANFFINTDGSVYRSTSSLKYKTDVQNSPHGLAELLTLRSVTYKGKSEYDADKTFGGLIAEEIHDAGLTEFVQYAEDGTPDALAYGPMVSLCIKAIQEQQALITTLTERIAALEAK